MSVRYVEIVFYRAAAELRRDAARAYLGTLWWFLEPILYMAVFYVVFGLGLRRGGPDFVVYLLTGLIVWKWLDGSVRAASTSIISSVGLMQQVYLPKIILPAVVVVMNSYKFTIIFTVFLLFLVWGWGFSVTQHWIAIPVLVLSQLLLVCAAAGLAAALIPVIPDLKYIVDFGLTLLFFVSGIFFDIHELTPAIQELLHYNPMIIFIESYREVLLYGHWPQWLSLAKVTLSALGLLILTILILAKLDRYYPRVVG